MKRYESKKNPGSYLTTDGVADPKTKTIWVKLDNGQEKTISIATLKRWWTPVAEEEAPTPTEEAPAEEETTEPIEEAPVEEEAPTEEEAPAEEEAPTEEEAPAPAKKSAPTEPKVSEEAVSLYNGLNEAYWLGELPNAKVTLRSSSRHYDQCVVKKNEEGYEVRLYMGALDNAYKVAATLMHAMVHIHCAEEGVEDTCQKGRYHNNVFKLACEAHDLYVERDQANGWFLTTSTEAFEKTLEKNGLLEYAEALVSMSSV